MIREALDALIQQGRSLTEDEAAMVMREVMAGEATPAQLGALLAAMRVRGETVEEIAGMARTMREFALRVPHEGPLIDTCGTGDVLEALGARIDLGPEGVATCLREANMGFMFAQAFHPAMKHAAPVRRELGVRTVFNILGPLSNPARAEAQVLGVPHPALVETMARALARLGTRHALVVHGEDGLDELTLSGPSIVCEVRNGQLATSRITPGDAGLEPAPLAALRGGTSEQNAAMMRAVFEGRPGPLRDFVLLNAAAALVVGGAARTIPEGVAIAARFVDTGDAGRAMERFIAASNAAAEGERP